MNSSSRDLSHTSEAGHGALPMPSTEACDFRLPAWNDLTNEQRAAICDEAELWSFDEDLERDAAHALYGIIRRLVSVEPPPMMVRFSAPLDGVGRAPRPPVIDGEGSRDDHNNTDPTPPTTEEEGA